MGLKTPIDAYGPAGMKQLAQGFWDAYQFDIETRMADEGRPDLRKLVNAHEYAEGEVLKTEKVRVSALRNVHPPIKESFALKFEFPGKTIVFSGDTAYLPPLAQFARGADILMHEVMLLPAIEFIVARQSQRRSHSRASQGEPHVGRRRRPHCDRGRSEDAGVQSFRSGRLAKSDRQGLDRRRPRNLEGRTGAGEGSDADQTLIDIPIDDHNVRFRG